METSFFPWEWVWCELCSGQEGGPGLEETGGAGPMSSPSLPCFTGGRDLCFCIHEVCAPRVSHAFRVPSAMSDNGGPARGARTERGLKEQAGNVWNKPSRPKLSNSFSQVVVTNGKCRMTCVRYRFLGIFFKTLPRAGPGEDSPSPGMEHLLCSPLSKHAERRLHFKVRRPRFGGIEGELTKSDSICQVAGLRLEAGGRTQGPHCFGLSRDASVTSH